MIQMKMIQMKNDNIATRRLGAVVGAERVDGVTPLLLAAQEGHLGRLHHFLHRADDAN